MPQLVFLPHEELCPEGMVIEADAGTTICDAALQNGIETVSYKQLTLPTTKAKRKKNW